MPQCWSVGICCGFGESVRALRIQFHMNRSKRRHEIQVGLAEVGSAHERDERIRRIPCGAGHQGRTGRAE